MMAILYSHLWSLLLFLMFDVAYSQKAESVQILGAGSTLAAQLYNQASFAFRFVEPMMPVSYTALGSGKGKCRLMNMSAECASSDTAEPTSLDFAGTDSLLKATDYAKYPDLQLYPTIASAVVPIYNLGSEMELVLAPDVLARIFRGAIRTWDHPEVVATNPTIPSLVPANQSIELVVRGDDSGTTEIFTKALSSFDFVFAQQIGTTSKPWKSVALTQQPGILQVMAYVATQHYTISYAVLGEATAAKLPIAKMWKSGKVVEASPLSIEFAALERGMDFGNNGEPPTQLTADIHDAQSPRAWPICGYTYLAVRKASLRPGATCAHVKGMATFWHWFWFSDEVGTMTENLGFSHLPPVVRDVVVTRFIQDITCNGQQVWQSEKKIAITGAGTGLIAGFFQQLALIYPIVAPQVELSFTNAEVANISAVEAQLLSSTYVLSHQDVGASVRGGATMIFAAAGLAVISTVDLVLDGPSLAMILEGQIIMWNDPAILALNPNGFNGTLSGNQRIVLLQGPISSSDLVTSLLSEYLPGYTGAALLKAPAYADEDQLSNAVIQTPFSLSLTALTGGMSLQLRVAKFRNRAGQVVSPSWQTIKACASDETFSHITNSFHLSQSSAPDCYPLTEVIYLSLMKSKCNMTTDAERTATVAFVEWLMDGTTLDVALQHENLAPLHNAVPETQAINHAALRLVSCQPQDVVDHSLIIWVVVGVVLGSVGLILALCGIYRMYYTREMREMRKQFSNDNVAQECAAAIARLDLDSVAWLSSVSTPNKIQLSFIRIIHLLTEVKPYIPDQLLMSLMEDEGAEGDAHAAQPESYLPAKEINNAVEMDIECSSVSGSTLPSTIYQSTPLQASQDESFEGHDTATCRSASTAPSTIVVGRRKLPSHDAHAGPAWTFRRCTFMYIRFGYPAEKDQTIMLQVMAHVTAKLIAAGKAHHATIDKVGFDYVNLLWGVTGKRTAAAAAATVVALEMQEIKSSLSAEQLDGFCMRIGVGTGMCAFATISASGHRFFVVGGKEVALATNIVTSEAANTLHCGIFITNEVYKDAQYSVQCFPRIWYQNQLFWQPTQVRQRGRDDEWMYELQNMNQSQAKTFSGELLLPVFNMVQKGEPFAVIKEQVQRLKLEFADNLTITDHASLDYLIDCLNPCESANLRSIRAL